MAQNSKNNLKAKRVSDKRHVSLELEEVEGASGYEVELTSKASGKISSFKMKVPIWKAEIRPGQYSLRLRSVDIRGVPGPWSESGEFEVKLPGTELISPKQNEEIKTGESKKFDTKFEWVSVPHTKKYRVEVYAEDGTKMAEDDFTESHGEIALPVAQKYKWTVTAISQNGKEGDPQDEPGLFTLIGGALDLAEVERPDDLWPEKIRWKAPDFAQYYTYLLQRKTEGEKGETWKKIEAQDKFLQTEIPISKDLAGGKLRIAVKANAPLREPSKLSIVEFDLYEGDRSPAAVEEAKLRHSLEKPSPWYFTASYLITRISYTAQNPYAGNNARVTYDALGGTGRLGLGYIHPKTNNGFLGLVDLSGATVNGSDVTYASSELHYVKRYTWGRSMIRPSAGIFYKELYETRTHASPDPKVDQLKISYAGPHIGFDYWRPFTSKYGIQVNTRIYDSLFGGSAPGGNKLHSEISYQFGLMGSYKLGPNITGFMGWAHRLDKASYDAVTSDVDSESRANAGEKQSVSIQGNYFNLLLEWGF